MNIAEIKRRCYAYHANPDAYRKRMDDILRMARHRGGQVAAARKYGVTPQCIHNMIKRELAKKQKRI